MKNFISLENFYWSDLPNEYIDLFTKENITNKTYQKFYKIKEGDVVVDFGANCGIFTYSILDSLPKIVYCVEPELKYVDALQKNVGENDNVKIINKFISSYDTENSLTFQSFISQNKIKKINFLKCDCEGGEYSIFTEENYDFIHDNISNISGEWHIVPEQDFGGKTVEKFIEFRNLYLGEGKFKYKIYDRFDNDLSDYIFDDNFLYNFGNNYHNTSHGQFIFYMWKQIDSKLDIVIQGNYTDYTDEIINQYSSLPFVNNIIVSCWKDNKKSISSNKVIFIRNKYPESPGTDNRNLQIVSSLNGLKKCQSQFSIKTRSDQKFTYDSMMKMYDFFMQNNQKSINYQYESDKPYNKIMVAGIYGNLLFCPRDHMFWGRTSDLIELFDIPLEKNGLIEKVRIPKQRLWMYYNHFVRTETYIGAHYCSKFNDELCRMILNAHECLYDGAIYWYHSKGVSDNMTPLVFKSFPKSMIYFDWPCKPEFTVQSYIDACSWHEDGY